MGSLTTEDTEGTDFCVFRVFRCKKNIKVNKQQNIMMKSMTGYGKVTKSRNGKNIEVEIRSLNSKTLDVHTKMPVALNSKDLDIRAMIAAGLERGKVDVSVTLTTDATEDNLRINEQLLEAYFRKTVEIARNFGVEQEEEIEDEWELTREAVEEALKQLDEFRIQEGQNLKADFNKRVSLILSYLDEVEPLANARVGIIRERILQRFEELKGTVDVDSNRLEQELIFYIEKLDITEEKVRLRNHCRYFIENIDADESTGKKLGFIAQEMGREINTLGSKANDAEIQKIVVKMKDELEKIKEQVLNIL